MKKEIKSIVENLGADINSFSSPAPIVQSKDDELTAALKEFFKKEHPEATLDKIVYTGDVWDINVVLPKADIVKTATNALEERGMVKGVIFKIKQDLLSTISKNFNIPTVSVRGLTIDKDKVKFLISLTLSNVESHGFVSSLIAKPIVDEAVELQRVKSLLESIIKEISTEK